MNKYIKFFIFSFIISLFITILLYKIFGNSYNYEYKKSDETKYWKIRYSLLNFILQYDNLSKGDNIKNNEDVCKNIKNNYKIIIKEESLSKAFKYLLDLEKQEVSIKIKSYINNFLLEQYYERGFYKKFLSLYKEKKFINSSKLSLLALNSYIKLKRDKEAESLFDKLFFKISPKRIISCIGKTNYNKFRDQYDRYAVFNKLYSLIKKNKYSLLNREIPYIKNNSFKLYFKAEIAYKGKNFNGTKKYLDKVNNIDLFPYKKQLLTKIGISGGDFSLFYPTLKYLKSNNSLHVMEDFLLNVVKMLYLKKEKMDFLKEVLTIIVKDGNSLILGDAYWYLFRVYLSEGNSSKALKILEDYSNKSTRYNEAIDFWLSKLSNKKRKNKINEYPFSYYYTLNNCFIDDKNKAKYLEDFKKILNEPSSEIDNIISNLKYFMSNHNLEESLEHISLLEKRVSVKSDKIALYLAKSILLTKKENLWKAYVSYRKSFNGYRNIVLPSFLKEVVMPLRYWKIIKKESELNNLDPYLVMALIRQESFYRINALSPVGARGLMQIMPATARYIARNNGINYSKSKLYEPDYNIKLGCIYLKEMLSRYKGSISKTLASYNAGPHRVDKWQNDIGFLDDESYTEAIPFRETRYYVKNIKRNIFYYRYYYPQYGKYHKKMVY